MLEYYPVKNAGRVIVVEPTYDLQNAHDLSNYNIVNSHTKHAIFPKELLDIYNNANTRNVVDNFIKIMSSNMNNNNLMMDSFRRQNYMQTFIAYINNNSFKYDA